MRGFEEARLLSLDRGYFSPADNARDVAQASEI
jgi:hypothetical protein